MVGFFIGLFLGSTLAFLIAACFSQEREEEAYKNGFQDGKWAERNGEVE